MKWFQYIGPPNRLFYGPVTREVNPGDLVELPDDWEHHEWQAATDAQVKAQAGTQASPPVADKGADSAKEQK